MTMPRHSTEENTLISSPSLFCKIYPGHSSDKLLFIWFLIPLWNVLHAEVYLESPMLHFRSKQTLIRDIKLSAAPKLFIHHSWSLFVLQLGAKQGTPKCRLCTVKIFNKQSEVKPFLIKKKEKEGGGGKYFQSWNPAGFFCLLEFCCCV